MSLLLEALKKAEKAKEEAQRRARDEGGEAPAELRIEADPAPASGPERKPVLTRDKLPEISSQPLEILSDEPPPAPRQKPEPERTQPAAAERAAAKKVFEAKFREPNPRLPFYITVGALGVFALGTVVYFWYQLRPPPPLVNTNPVRSADERPVEVAAPVKPPAPAPAAQASPAIPGLPASAKAPEPVRTPAPPPAELRPKPPLAKPAAPVAEAPRLALPESPRTVSAPSRPLPQVHPRVAAGYSAYLAGDLAKAGSDYEEALREEPGNRDALLGLAALDIKSGRYEAAEAAYLRLLQANPRDAEAQAALIALRGGRLDPLVAESRVKSLLAADPGAHVLHFTLGNQLAQQGRWAEAQAEYFKAFSAEPENPDFAYNLAVSLDHVRQPRLALEYYRRALALAEKRGAGFDLAAARTRAAQLEK